MTKFLPEWVQDKKKYAFILYSNIMFDSSVNMLYIYIGFRPSDTAQWVREVEGYDSHH